MYKVASTGTYSVSKLTVWFVLFYFILFIYLFIYFILFYFILLFIFFFDWLSYNFPDQSTH